MRTVREKGGSRPDAALGGVMGSRKGKRKDGQ